MCNDLVTEPVSIWNISKHSHKAFNTLTYLPFHTFLIVYVKYIYIPHEMCIYKPHARTILIGLCWRSASVTGVFWSFGVKPLWLRVCKRLVLSFGVLLGPWPSACNRP